ncbi:MAG: (2Fe-2S)-binding protein [SAR202 cluster bacterium]|nr:ferredoxin [Chloroflexota bacterium]MCH2510110.1 (2Fe-2S)-binding protein [Dehalococcoidia bacterium]MQG48240.1 (2Fe-2S)-binding protein [SAR202 cluster bacterium]PKB74258.1 MAG: ferredoxin [SAR202 cluster bacterium Io17-Chloro-G8]MBC50655.1 ferredoxin [Chloroflexota bacterium]|tara:strand:+ start:4671 stop:5159 length:489 start_codon:yes stop_codon:yes gene_type:complete
MNLKVRLKINGADHELDIPARRLLVDCIRYDIGLTGTKESCSVGVCGACAVLVDGEMYASCITLAAAVDGAEIITIEGIAENGNLHPVQQAFIDHGGFQCGICTPGQVIAAKSLLEENPTPTEDEIKEYMMGNLCRCTGYYGILNSIAAAAETINKASGSGE